MKINNVNDLQKAIASGPHTFPGGYPVYFLCEDGGVLSHAAVVEEIDLITSAIEEDNASDWRVMTCDINWEDETLVCDHTGEAIESAYGDYDE